MRLLSIARRLFRRREYNEFTSVRLRDQFRALGVDVGLYSYGCFDLARVPPGVRIGRYCSFAETAHIFLKNHGIEFIGLSAYLYNEKLGVVDRNMLPPATLDIGDDVWLGHNAIITSKVDSIGRGAVIAAGAVVTKPVPAYAIVAGNPARVIRMRFDPPTIAAIEASQWWRLALPELRQLISVKPDMIFSPAAYFAQDAPSTGADPIEMSDAPQLPEQDWRRS